MDQLISALDKLLKYKNEDSSCFYTYLSDYILTEQDEEYFMEKFIPKVYYLYDKKILRKDIVYLSLLASQNHDILQKFLDYDKSILVLNIEDPISLFDYYIYEKRHWICEIVKNPSDYDKIIHLKTVYNKLNLIKYILQTNSDTIDIEFVHTLSSQINMEYLDDFWKFYVEEIKIFIDISQFCKPLLKTVVGDSELFTSASKNTLLDTLSNNVDLGESSLWENILEKLKCTSRTKELDIFISFIVIANLIKLVMHNETHNIDNSEFEKIRTWLLEVNDKKLQVELLENIFYLMFNRNKNEFTCKEKEVRFILFLLKSVIDDIQLKKTHPKDSSEHKKICTLSSHVTDCLWRLDLIIYTKMSPKVTINLLNYMVAPPESLIHICLKGQNFERAQQVIQIFNLRTSDLAQEVKYAEAYLKFKKFLRKNGKLKETVEEFLKSNSPHSSQDSKTKLNELSKKHDVLVHFKNDTFMNVFDLALTQPKTWEETEILLEIAEEKYNLDECIHSGYLNFYRRIKDLAKGVGSRTKVSLPQILISSDYSLDLKKYNNKNEFYAALANLYDEFQHQNQNTEKGILNKGHPSHKTLLKMNEICLNYVQETCQEKDAVQYILRVFNYLKAFSRVFFIEENTSVIISKGQNTSYFEILNYNRSELTGKLLFEKQLDPTEFEKYFGKLKLDFLYHVVGNCFPTINLHVQENVTVEELYHDNMMYIPSPSIIIYIQKRNWLLAFILSEMYKVEGVKIDITEVRLRTFFNYLKMSKIQHLKELFDNNDIVAALQNCISTQHVRLHMREYLIEQDISSLQSHGSGNSDGLETAEEVFEDSKHTNWRNLLDVIDSIPESQLKKKPELIVLKNNLLVNIVQECAESEYYRYAFYISDRGVRMNTILNNFKRWPGKFVADIIKAEVSRFDCLLDSKLEELNAWLQHVELNEELRVVFEVKSWYKSYNFCKNEPEQALDKILLTDKLDFLQRFLNLYSPSENILTNITTNYLSKIMDLNLPLPKIKTLLDSLPFEHALNTCHNLLTILRNLEHLQFIADYLNNNVTNDVFLKNVQVSLKMLTVFTASEQEQLYCLINEPLSILEVLLMNTKLDKIGAILETLNIHNLINDEEVITVEKVDQLLRKYAEKSLDFRVITHPQPQVIRTPEAKLLQSLDSLSLASDKKPFVVPETVPTKDEWVQNDEVVECMSCRQVTFSMFNRRHHCRRCGRVVCYGCSLKRMLVPTYGDILVRVCLDCYSQTVQKSDSHSSDKGCTRSYIEEWLLNDDPEHNKIIREEFSYEHAPSTSLCFSILRHHSKNVGYPKFLLEQCEILLKLLKPNHELTQEIDYLLVVKMLKSLATAAKIVSAESMLSTGASMADKILSQAELLALLAERGCLNLMPMIGAQNLYIDATVLRRLRDKLLQREQWNLALEVSTKAGLDNTGVFAAWGKSCLKAGSLLVARDKFQKCLDKNKYETSSMLSRSDLNLSVDSLNLSRSCLSSRISTSSTISGSEAKPMKDPPLLHEIIQILETKTRTIRPEVLEKAQRLDITGSIDDRLNLLAPFTVHIDTAISVVNRIKNLKEIVNGNFSLSYGKDVNVHTTKPTIDPIFYDECVYYLTKYGTYLSLLDFYVRHGNITTALLCIVENKLSCELFVEVYMKCLRDGVVNILQEQMSLIDSSLNIWKDYLKQLCRYLEKHQLLNCLYQLQLYIGDYVRAAMTCIRFYEEGVKSFTELANNVSYLYKGEEHLRQILEQEQWVEVASVGNDSNTSKDSFEERMLTNPDLVMKIETKDVNKHINTVKRQVEVVNYLSQWESSGVNTRQLLQGLNSLKACPVMSEEVIKIPTLFGSVSDKITLAVMAIVAGENLEEGFELASKIINDFKLRPIKVYCLTGKHLAQSERYSGISQLVNCIKSTGINDSAISDMLDEMLVQAVGTLIKANVSGTKIEDLIKLIQDKATKISAYIEAKQLKTAYFLAVKYKRTADVRRIQREAELLNMPTIKALCQKVLHNSPQTSMSHSKE